MAQVERSVATLRIIGEDLDPSEITKLLGCSPSFEQIKGQVLKGEHSGKERIATFGTWQLYATDKEPENLDDQVSEILGKLSDNIEIWQSISSRYRIDLFCGLFMGSSNEGLILSPESLLALGKRGVELDLDVYGPLRDDNEKDA